jgi:hypothetical protein
MPHTVTLGGKRSVGIGHLWPDLTELGKYSGGISLSIQVKKFRLGSPLHCGIKHE